MRGWFRFAYGLRRTLQDHLSGNRRAAVQFPPLTRLTSMSFVEHMGRNGAKGQFLRKPFLHASNPRMAELGRQGEVTVATQVDGRELGVDSCERVCLERLEIDFRRSWNGLVCMVDEKRD